MKPRGCVPGANQSRAISHAGEERLRNARAFAPRKVEDVNRLLFRLRGAALVALDRHLN